MADEPVSTNQRVIVTDISMPLGSMVEFMVKWAIASIPAMIILAVIGAVVWFLVFAIFGSSFRYPLS
jgi:hypothetical protein